MRQTSYLLPTFNFYFHLLKRASWVYQVAFFFYSKLNQHLPSMCKNLGSMSSTAQQEGFCRVHILVHSEICIINMCRVEFYGQAAIYLTIKSMIILTVSALCCLYSVLELNCQSWAFVSISVLIGFWEAPLYHLRIIGRKPSLSSVVHKGLRAKWRWVLRSVFQHEIKCAFHGLTYSWMKTYLVPNSWKPGKPFVCDSKLFTNCGCRRTCEGRL